MNKETEVLVENTLDKSIKFGESSMKEKVLGVLNIFLLTNNEIMDETNSNIIKDSFKNRIKLLEDIKNIINKL